MTGSNRWNPNDVCASASKGNTEGKIRGNSSPRNDSGVEIPGWSRQLVHNTPALIFVYGYQFIHFRFRRWRRLFLRFLPTKRSTLSGLGGETEFLGQPKRRSSSAALCNQGNVGMRFHTTGSIR